MRQILPSLLIVLLPMLQSELHYRYPLPPPPAAALYASR